MKNKLILTLNNSLKYGALMGVVFILLSLYITLPDSTSLILFLE